MFNAIDDEEDAFEFDELQNEGFCNALAEAQFNDGGKKRRSYIPKSTKVASTDASVKRSISLSTAKGTSYNLNITCDYLWLNYYMWFDEFIYVDLL